MKRVRKIKDKKVESDKLITKFDNSRIETELKKIIDDNNTRSAALKKIIKGIKKPINKTII